MKVIFTYHPYSAFSILIRLATFSKFSHAALMLSDQLIIDSTLSSGVQLSTLEDFCKRYKNTVVVDVPVADETKAINFAINQVGKPYDWSAILGMITQRNWQEDDSWFCSELIEAIFKAGDTPRFRDDLSRITPQMSWAVL